MTNIEQIAEVLCTERCAQAGDPPCSRVCSEGLALNTGRG